ncbi:MAG: DUF1214 domain-containing protein [Deltaproteobacteria bacterium]|nr:DUF1214 domain-containing protein [Deltaproteobacteria bacterium]
MARDDSQADATDAAARAYADLTAVLGEIEAGYISPDRGMHTSAERSAGRFLLANALQHGFQCWFDSDPKRPMFQRWLGLKKKLLGDNPDALYYGAIVDPAGSYRIRGNVHGACYTSFSVETGAQEGHISKGVISSMNDTQFDIAADGSYEIIASPEPQPRNWLRLEPDAGSITTRHYWEWERNVATDPTFHVPLWIEPVEDPGPAAPMDDAAIAAGIQRVINFIRGVTIDFPDLPPEVMPSWVSNVVNQFDNSAYDESNAEIGYAAVDNAYLQARYELDPDQALIMRGRFPRCRFGNVVLWNHRLQTPPYRYRRVSLNRNQVRYEKDGSFAIAVAQRDPGVPNWIDTAGLPTGMIFWRFLLPEEPVPPVTTEVVAVDAVNALNR